MKKFAMSYTYTNRETKETILRNYEIMVFYHMSNLSFVETGFFLINAFTFEKKKSERANMNVDSAK